jgi:hypothetical protein
MNAHLRDGQNEQRDSERRPVNWVGTTQEEAIVSRAASASPSNEPPTSRRSACAWISGAAPRRRSSPTQEPTACTRYESRAIYRSWEELRRWHARQRDQAEDRYPDHVQRVSEQGEAEKAVADPRAEAVDVEPNHHYAEPEQACRHMDAVTADQREASELGIAVTSVPAGNL